VAVLAMLAMLAMLAVLAVMGDELVGADDLIQPRCLSSLVSTCSADRAAARCGTCAGRQQHVLRSSGCSAAEVATWCGASAAVVAPRLRVQADGSIHDPSGRKFVAKGVNWGKRLAPTGPGGLGGLYNASDPRIQLELFPNSNLVRLVLDYYSGGVCATDIFDETRASQGYIAQSWLDEIDHAVAWTSESGIWIVITLRNNLGTVSPHGERTNSVACDADYVSNVTARGYWYTTWRFLAQRYAASNNIAWYELASEPHLLHKTPPADGSSGPWVQCHPNASEVRELFQEAVENLRTVDASTPIAVAPMGYEHCPGLGPLDLLHDAAGQLIYAMNWPCSLKTSATTVSYGDSARCSDFARSSTDLPCIPACAPDHHESDPNALFTYDKALIREFMSPFLNFGLRYNVPLWIDQLMCPPKLWAPGIAAAWLHDSMDVANFSRVHFSWWTWKGDFQDASSQSVLTPPVGVNTSASRRDLARYVVDEDVYALYRQAFQ
jgi:hypothetical protein